MLKNEKYKIWIDLLYDVVGGYCYALAVNLFTAPNMIAPGGVSGLSTLINYLIDDRIKIGMISFIINVPLIILAYMFLGKKFTAYTLKTVVVLTLVLDYGVVGVQPYVSNPLMAAIFAGVLMGAGLGIILARGSSTGGTDIVGLLIQRKMPQVSIAKLILCVDCVVLALSVIVYKNIESAMLGVTTMYITSTVMGKILYGMDSAIMMHIVSTKSPEIASAVYSELGRGATLLQAKGAYKGADMQIALCAVRRAESAKLRKVVNAIDPHAFIMVSEASEILGLGFKPIK